MLLDFEFERRGGGNCGPQNFFPGNRFGPQSGSGPGPVLAGHMSGGQGPRGISPMGNRGGPPFPPRMGGMFMRGPRPGNLFNII